MAPVKCCLFFLLSMSALDSGVNNIMAMATSDKVHHCGHDSHWFSFDKHCYLPMSNSLNWNSAEEFCRRKEANLTSIHSGKETNFVTNLVTGMMDHAMTNLDLCAEK
uniref:U73-Liphistoxin-Lth1b_1 n=1 Tax=Liphistius thaleban TaxID=1905330 RepID=A0A4Q8K4B0_9ARAC